MTKGNSSRITVLETRVVAGSGGGPDKTILNSPRYLWSAGYETLCLYMRPPGNLGFEFIREKARTWQAPLIEVDDRGPLDWRILGRLLAICRSKKVTIWHGHDYKSNALGLVLKRVWPMHLVTTVHGWVHQTRRTPIYYWIDRLCLPRYETVICVSDDLKHKCLKCGVNPARCHLIENAIDTEEFKRTRNAAEAKASLGLAPHEIVIGAVGRLSGEKGFDLLIRATANLLETGINCHLLIVGEGPARANLEKLIVSLNLNGRVTLLGYQSEIRPIYEAMDVFALSSLREGLPNVVLEAMALEVPVVATRIAGVPQLITHGQNGLLIDPGSVPALVESLKQILASEEWRRNMGREGRTLIESRYSFRERMEKIRLIYDQIIAKR